jgi:hypothetical protein
LRADLVLRGQQLEVGTDSARRELRAALQRWKADVDLAGIRDPGALDKLPEKERQGWRDFWREVDTLLAKAQGNCH